MSALKAEMAKLMLITKERGLTYLDLRAFGTSQASRRQIPMKQRKDIYWACVKLAKELSGHETKKGQLIELDETPKMMKFTHMTYSLIYDALKTCHNDPYQGWLKMTTTYNRAFVAINHTIDQAPRGMPIHERVRYIMEYWPKSYPTDVLETMLASKVLYEFTSHQAPMALRKAGAAFEKQDLLAHFLEIGNRNLLTWLSKQQKKKEEKK